MHKRRGQSFYAEVINPSAKKVLNQCCLCGKVGLKPGASQIDYDYTDDEVTVNRHVKEEKFFRKLSVDRLRRIYDPLKLDELGRCEVCVRTTERDKEPN